MNALGSLLRFRMRRDRVYVSVWVLAIALFALFGAAALASTYDTEHTREGVVRLVVADPSLLALRGAPNGAGLGAFFVMEMAAYLAIMVAFMNTLLAVRHARADEEAGRTELIVATRAGRRSATVATLLDAVIANALVGIVTALAMMAAGYTASGSFTLGWALASTGIAFFGVGLLAAQVFSSGRAANGWCTAAIGVAFVLRAAGDAQAEPSADGLSATPAAASWFSPIGWTQRANAFTDDRLWPGLLGIVLALVLVAAAFVLQSVRDNGAGLVATRSGRRWASPALSGSWGLAWRLQRGSIIAWGIGAVLTGAAVGGLGKTVRDAATGNPELTTAIQSLSDGSGGILETFLGVMLGLIGLLVTGAALQTVMRLRQEEAAGTAEVVLATPLSRLRWFLGYVVLGVVASAVILALAGLTAGLTLAGSGEEGIVGAAFALALAQLPAVAVYLAITAVVFAVLPRATIPVGWTLLGIGIVLGEFGGLFGLPDWTHDIVPGTHVPQAPLASADFSGAWIMSAASVIVIAVAASVLRRRSLVMGD